MRSKVIFKILTFFERVTVICLRTKFLFLFVKLLLLGDFDKIPYNSIPALPFRFDLPTLYVMHIYKIQTRTG